MTQSITNAVGRRSQLYVVIYLNRAGLSDTLVSNGVCTAREFEGFILGFNQASPLFSIVDVGYGKEATDVKLRGEHAQRDLDMPLFLKRLTSQSLSKCSLTSPRRDKYSSVVGRTGSAFCPSQCTIMTLTYGYRWP